MRIDVPRRVMLTCLQGAIVSAIVLTCCTHVPSTCVLITRMKHSTSDMCSHIFSLSAESSTKLAFCLFSEKYCPRHSGVHVLTFVSWTYILCRAHAVFPQWKPELDCFPGWLSTVARTLLAAPGGVPPEHWWRGPQPRERACLRALFTSGLVWLCSVGGEVAPVLSFLYT